MKKSLLAVVTCSMDFLNCLPFVLHMNPLPLPLLRGMMIGWTRSLGCRRRRPDAACEKNLGIGDGRDAVPRPRSRFLKSHLLASALRARILLPAVVQTFLHVDGL